MPLVVPRKVTFLAKSEYFTSPGLKGLAKKLTFIALGQVAVDRAGGSRSEARKVSVIGLLVWSPKKPLGDPYEGFSLGLNSSWFPITRNPEGLHERLQDFIEVISGPTPVRDSGCETCKFIADRREIFGAE